MSSNGPSFFQRNYIWVIAAFLLAIPVVVYGKIQAGLTNNNNVRQWLPADFPATEIYDYFVHHFGTDEFAIVSWQGCTMDDPRLNRFPELLRTYRDADGDALFARVQTGPEMIAQLTGKPFDLSREEAVRRLTGVVIGRDEKTTSVIVKLTEKGDANRRVAVEVMRMLATKELGIPAHDVHMAGDAVTNAEVDIASQDSIESLVLWSIAIALTCAFLSLRSFRLVFVVFAVAIYSSLFPECMIHFLGGNMNLVLVVMPVLVYVLTLSAGVHLVNYYRDALADGAPSEDAPRIAVVHGWLPCTMAAATTAIGLGSLCVSHIRPVRDFGFYSALGILGSLAFIFLLLPSMLVAAQKMGSWRNKGHAQGDTLHTLTALDRAVTGFGRFVVAHKEIMAIGCLALLVFLGWGARYIHTSVRPSRFFDEDSRLMTDYRWLASADRFGPQIPIELVVAFDSNDTELNTLNQLQLVSDLQRDLMENRADLIGSTMSAATFAPDLKNVSRNVRYTVNQRLAKNRKAYNDVHFYSSEPSKGDGLKELWRISARVESAHLEYDEVIRQVADHVKAFLARRKQEHIIGREDEKAAHDARVANALQVVEKNKERFRDDEEALSRLRVEYENHVDFLKKQLAAKLEVFADDTKGVEVIYTGMVPLFYEAQNELLSGLFKSFVLAFVLIAVVMVAWFRSVRAGLLTMFPNVFPAAVIFGYMGWRGLLVDIGSMMTASVAMGIAVDDTVHFLTWFRRGLREGLSREDALIKAYQRCAQAMMQTTMIAGLGLLIFVASSFQPVSQFGLLMFVLLVAALVGDLIFLPALLAGVAGKLFIPRLPVKTPPAAEQPVA